MSRLLDQVLDIDQVEVECTHILVGIRPVAPRDPGSRRTLLVWSAAVLQAVVVPALALAPVVLQAVVVPVLVLASPVPVLLLVSVETVMQLVPVEAVLSEVVGPDRRSGLTGNLTEHLLVVASSSFALALVSLVALVRQVLREEMVPFLPALLGQA